MPRRLLYEWIFNVGAIWVASVFIDGVSYSDDYWILILTGFVFGIVNLILKPIVKLLALPLIILTLGVALFFVNLFMLYITTWIVPGFSIDTFMDAVWATIVVWAVNWVLHAAFDADERRTRRRLRGA